MLALKVLHITLILSCKVVEIIKKYIFERKSKVLSYCKLPLICKSEYEKLMVGLHDIATGIFVQMFLTITTMTCPCFPPSCCLQLTNITKISAIRSLQNYQCSRNMLDLALQN